MKSLLFKVNCLLIPMLVGTRTYPCQSTLFPSNLPSDQVQKKSEILSDACYPIFTPYPRLWLPVKRILREAICITQQNYDSHSTYLLLMTTPQIL